MAGFAATKIVECQYQTKELDIQLFGLFHDDKLVHYKCAHCRGKLEKDGAIDTVDEV